MTEKAFIIQLHQLDYKYHLIFGQSVIFNCKNLVLNQSAAWVHQNTEKLRKILRDTSQQNI